MKTQLQAFKIKNGERDVLAEEIQRKRNRKPRKVLELARAILNRRRLTVKAFGAVLDAVTVQTPPYIGLTPLVETAYAKLAKKEQKKERYAMLNFFWLAGNYEKAVQFLPRRFNRPYELVPTMEVCMRLGNAGRAKSLIPKLRRLIKMRPGSSWFQGWVECLASYYVLNGQPERALGLLDSARPHLYSAIALNMIVQIHIAGALLRIKQDFRDHSEYNRSWRSYFEKCEHDLDSVFPSGFFFGLLPDET